MAHPPNIPLTPQTDERNFPVWDAKAGFGRSGHPYPKMLTREFMPEDVESWQQANRRYDKQNGEFWETRCPRSRKVLPNGKVIPGDPVPIKSNQDLLDAGFADTIGQDVICKTEKEEAEIRLLLGLPTIEEEKKASSVTRLMQNDGTEAELQRLREKNEELEALLERNVALNTKIKAEQATRAKMKKPEPRITPDKEIWDEFTAGAKKLAAKEEKAKKRGRPKGSHNKPKVLTTLGDDA